MNTKTLLPDYARNARGYLKIEEREALYQLAGNVPSGGLIINIGIEYGASMICLNAGKDKSVFLIGIDIDCSKFIKLPEANLDIYRPSFGGKVEIEEMSSSQWILDWIEKIAQEDGINLDLVFIDGDHGYRGVTLDTLYCSLLKKNGIVMFHDCFDWTDTDKPHRLVPGVMQAVDDWTKTIYGDSWIEHDPIGTSRLFQRIK